MTPNEKLGLISDLSRIAQGLTQPGLSEGDMASALSELRDTAAALGVPTDARRDDAPVFLEGTEKIETATWTQCGGLLFAVSHDKVRDPRALASRIARRLFELAPTHR